MSQPETTRIMQRLPDSVDDLQDAAEINQELLDALRLTRYWLNELHDPMGNFDFTKTLAKADAAIARATQP